jgi:uncharacterized protein (DUF488 family)
MTSTVYSLGHSNLPIDAFLALLRHAEISAIADVRSSPHSSRSPWFGQKELKQSLRSVGIAYAFLGKELGGRPRDPALYRAGVADYSAMAATLPYLQGLERLLAGAERHRVAMVCSEKDPLECHRCLLVGRSLSELGVDTCHVHHSGSQELQSQAIERLLREERVPMEDMLWPWDDRVNEAFRRRNHRVAYSLNAQRNSVDEWRIHSR